MLADASVQGEEEGAAPGRSVETVVRWGLGPGLRLCARAGPRLARRLCAAAAALLSEAAAPWRALALQALARPEAWNAVDA